jgi:hypothetical protein
MSDPQSELAAMRDRLKRLEALEAIRDLKARYARGSDAVLRGGGREQAVALANLFTEDATGDYGAFGQFSGRASLQHAFEVVIPSGFTWSTHLILSSVLDVHGDTGEGTWYFVVHAQPRSPENAPMTTFYGHYEEKYRKVNGAWKIAALRLHFSAPGAP